MLLEMHVIRAALTHASNHMSGLGTSHRHTFASKIHSFVVAQKLHQVVALFLFLQIIRLSAGIRPATALINSLHVGLGASTSTH